MMISDQFLGWLATFLFSVMYIPQIYKTFKSKSINDVSLSMFSINFFANIVALIYALKIGQKPLQIKYILALFFIVIYLYFYFSVLIKNHLRKKKA